MNTVWLILPTELQDVGTSQDLIRRMIPYDSSSPRRKLRKPLAEFIGTMILLLIGTGVDCQVGLSSNTAISASPKGVEL
jgi:hypothetical protein